MLKPQSTSTRELVSLDGLWKFGLVTDDLEQTRPWTKPLDSGLEAPVPASYNDIFVDPKIHDHVGWVVYQRAIRVPRGWTQDKYFIRVEAATHEGRVYVNDKLVAEHIGGYTPFDAEVTQLVKPGEEFRVTIAVNNELTNTTIPPGFIVTTETGARKQTYLHDFYNYAGLARSVWLYNVPDQHINDVTITTDLKESTGIIKYSIDTTSSSGKITVQILDEDQKTVANASGLKGEIKVASAKLWNPGAAYLYQFKVSLHDSNGTVLDEYTVATGIRKVEVRGNKFLINNKPFYFTGFGRHEDTAVRGKGHDQAYMVHDFALMDWIGANSFRTSHYPYAEEVMDYADRKGIVVIDETPAVGLNLAISSGLFGGIKRETWSEETCNDQTREANAQAIRELVARDKNHPCVVMWSIANEPASSEEGAREYFEPLVKVAREADPTRPVCFINVMFAKYNDCLISDLFDVLCLNRYYGWYISQGDLAAAEVQLEEELRGWEKKYNKPMLMTEYGADTLAGLHSLHNLPWSEEFQVQYYDMYHRVFDRIESMTGEQVWNFADFQTAIQIFRIDGNKKGIFTRDRKPKAIAHELRKRWTKIRAQGNQVTPKANL
ncbi:beta-glucuronidase [Polyplosphaeria fusca]|uniref:Beta-glucuronidase n=1 Tax=Polyplosphaeria fusca TaxID=682080 RepID=A0A9P4QMY1_9PLEO|nr:beta-glucuronidase [Polyplosphaeria fusca]